jgi:hypothetical protein
MMANRNRRPASGRRFFVSLGGKEAEVQLKLFDRKLVDLAHLEADINQWLAANPKFVTIQRDFHVYHSQTTREESVLVALWYEPRSGL